MSRRNRSRQQQPNRRDFLWDGACAALTATGIASTIFDLRLINAAAANSLAAIPKKRTDGAVHSRVNSGYKALVCIFLFGGNDSNNLIVPTDDATYNNQYAPQRGVLAVPQPGMANGLLPLNPLTSDGHTYGMHPSCPELAALFNSGQLAVLCNTGTLLAPVTRQQYLSRSVALPPQLFSHNDQQVEWQTSIPDKPAKTGWGGRCADLLYSMNTNNNVSMNISLAGSNTYEVGNVINEYNVSSSGAISLNIPTSGTGPAQLQALKDILALDLDSLKQGANPNVNRYEGAFAAEMNTAIANAQNLNSAIAATAATNYFTTPFPTSSLGKQLKMIARLIQASPTLGHNRQVFFASVGGFDLHTTEGNYTGSHANLLTDLSASMNAFYKATVQLGAAPNVTTFTASDFSRTFPVNTGLGTDHGWGSHHLIMGGGVVGRKLYGQYPTLVVGGPDDTSTGRWIPSTSVDQYSATLAKWFGVSPGNLSTVFPNLGRFATPDLGFMG